jgi:hypothetical protein
LSDTRCGIPDYSKAISILDVAVKNFVTETAKLLPISASYHELKQNSQKYYEIYSVGLLSPICTVAMAVKTVISTVLQFLDAIPILTNYFETE